MVIPEILKVKEGSNKNELRHAEIVNQKELRHHKKDKK
jgi:hypothetical protein